MEHLPLEDNELTKNESLVMSVLVSSSVPMSAYKILEKLKAKGLRAPLQVYRALDRLTASGMAHRIESINSFVACRGSSKKPDAVAVFVVCNDCGDVKEISDNLIDSGLKKLAKNVSFSPTKHTVEMHGLCYDCVEKPLNT